MIMTILRQMKQLQDLDKNNNDSILNNQVEIKNNLQSIGQVKPTKSNAKRLKLMKIVQERKKE